ncbi:ATP-binding protein [Cellulomonas bogoriensis]|uniref:Anti-sigma regulatory factor n=1 Tax=Cellulomonas bogoriensis 69B4 = DSM 16987 TaxID=1386082 RepID=A0A0A0BP54_9CELL|nr:ATP-binding protein [Cellulomonas bogoriensis]KGM09716.1 anti-sigma regulatory factor [Cellulomonas bogoriensis 69B4 = DSM 16987]
MSTSLKSSRPPEEFTAVATWVLDTPGELTTLRASLYKALTGNALPPGGGLGRVPEKIVLVASELATNALRHGVPPTIVQLLSNGEEFLLDVADHDTTAAPHIAGVREPGAGGFGLYLAQTLSLDVGWYTSETTKHVWARFSTTGADAPTGT